MTTHAVAKTRMKHLQTLTPVDSPSSLFPQVSIVLALIAANAVWTHLFHLPFHSKASNIFCGGVFATALWLCLARYVRACRLAMLGEIKPKGPKRQFSLPLALSLALSLALPPSLPPYLSPSLPPSFPPSLPMALPRQVWTLDPHS